MHGAADDALCVIAAPVAGLRTLCHARRGCVPAHVVWVCKGFEADTHLLPHQVIAGAAEQCSNGVLSGPSFAREVGQSLPVALTVAARPPNAASARSPRSITARCGSIQVTTWSASRSAAR